MRNKKGQLITSKPPMSTEDIVQFAMDAQFNYTGEQPVKCQHFGCGKTLSPGNRLFGDRCPDHQKPTPFTSLIDPFIYQ